MRNLRRFRSALLLLGLSCLLASEGHAATDTKTATVSATVNAAASLTLGVNTVTFADADPGTTASITATEGAITVTAKARTSANGAVTLTVLAADDLKSGSDSIGIGNVTWTVSGTGYQAGTLNKSSAQSVGSWTGPGVRSGALTFALANSFTYATGSYSTTVTYTLTAP
jgi:hypothetical protein